LVQEKHRTIIFRLTGVRTIGMTIDSSLLYELEELMKSVIAAHPYVRSYFGNRKSSPGYNFVFRRLLDLLGHSKYAADFPPLKSRKKRTETVRLWRRFCSFLNWPYINSDERHFGASYATRVEELSDRRGFTTTVNQLPATPEQLLGLQLQPTPTETTTNTDADSDRFRWDSPHFSDGSSEGWQDNTELCELFRSFDSALCGADCGPDYGDFSGLWQPGL
jgi:hypothetical protein